MYMTAYGGTFLGPIAKFFGMIMNYIYIFFEDTLGFENVNIALIIIIFTIVIYIILLPLTYQQQKFSNLQRQIQPELQAIQKKYKGKKDQATMVKQQEETQALYDKYGISMTGSCVQLLIQLPILYALFGVFNNLPAYLDRVKVIFSDLVTKIQATPDYTNKMQSLYEGLKTNRIRVDFLDESISETDLGNYVIDVLYKLSESGWDSLRDSFGELTDVINVAQSQLQKINYFFILNISDTPLNIIKTGWSNKTFILIFAALLIPIFSYLSQVLNLRLTQVKQNSSDPMNAQLQTMNRVMPLISLVFVFSVPVGLGLYWISSALFRSLCQVLLNKHFQKMDLDAIIEKNKEKAEKKKAKRLARNENISNAAKMNTKNSNTMSSRAYINNKADKKNVGDSDVNTVSKANTKYKEGSMASKAAMVSDFNNKNTRK